MPVSEHVPLSDHLKVIKAQIKDGGFAAAYDALAALADSHHSFPVQQKLARLMAAIPPETVGLRPLRLALLAGCTLDHFIDILRLSAALRGLALDVWVAPFDTIEQTILDSGSGLYSFAPDITWIFTTHRDVALTVAPGTGDAEVADAVTRAVQQAMWLWETLRSRHACQIIHNTADIPMVDVFGHYEANVSWGRRSLLRAYNLGLMQARSAGVTLFDLDEVAASYGKRQWIDARYWHHSKHAFAFDAAGLVAHEAAAVLAAVKGLAKKCLVLDLDNTLWGGVIGDDGVEGIQLGSGTDGEAFAAFQDHIKALKERGVILAVCSKNEEANAKAPFHDHPDMRLSLDDIAVFRANWDNKADNIRAIAEILNIGLDSMVFLDDNPVERGLVRRYLPMVTVPELPIDPAGYLDALVAGRWFETVSFGAEDCKRADYYRENAARADLQSQFRDHTDYLTSLEMVAECGDLDSFRLPRMAQLIGKSNQFHLTGTRYGEAELRAKVDGATGYARWYGLRDRFGDNGLISTVILDVCDDVLDINTWVMSCRVLARGMEEFILNDVAAQAMKLGCGSITARYIPSAKNGLVAELYTRLGFSVMTEEPGGTVSYQLILARWSPRPTTIQASKR